MRRLAFLALPIILLVTYTGFEANAQSNQKIKTLKSRAKELNKKIETVKKQIGATRRATKYVLSDIEKVDNRLENINDAIRDNWDRQRQLKRDLQIITTRLAEEEQRLKSQTAIVAERIRSVYMQPEGTALGSILASESLGDFASRKAIFNRIAEQDHDLFMSYQKRVTEVEEKKKAKIKVIEAAKDLEVAQRQRQAEFQAHKLKKKGYLEELRDEMGDLREQYEELDRENDRIVSQLQAFQARSLGGSFGGKFIRPVSGRITSGFGNRFHPVLKRTRLHAGIDFGAPTGTPIRAAASGVVVSASYRGGYGNTVIIDHGGGYATLYGHCSRVYVSAGQRVAQGQRIAAVGSTGLSTGPHLHFEIRINGRPVNPMGRL